MSINSNPRDVIDRSERSKGAVKVPRKPMSKFSLYSRRFLRNRAAVAGLGVFFLIVAFAVFGPLLQRYDHVEMDFLALTKGPSAEHWFGTNQAGNDLFAQLVFGLQRSLLIALTVSTGATVIAALVGASAAYFGGNVEKVLLGVIHLLMVVPTFLIVAMMSNDSGGDWKVISLVLIFMTWFFLARTVWTLSLSLREREYIHAARYMGVRGTTIVVRHMLPNIGSLLIINWTLGVVNAVQTETSLSFLGFGVKLPDVSLGSLIRVGADSITSAPWLFLFPAAVLTLLTVSMALIADGLRDALDPTSAAGGRA